MISELKDEEIMDFLMTSDFEDDYNPDELKYLLIKWRYFYRLAHGKHELLKTDTTFEINKLESEIKSKELRVNELLTEIANGQNIIDSLKNRKLTLKERFSGKIITKEDED